MSRDLILGVDPGLNGALAFVDLASGELVEIYDVPTLQLKNKRELNEYELGRLVDDYAFRLMDAWIERAWPRPGEANTLSFAFGAVYGAMRGVVCANFVPLHDVLPVAWKRAHKIPPGDQTGDESRKAAGLLWPASVGRWPAKKHHGRAEAALIAAYGRRQFLKEHGAQEAA